MTLRVIYSADIASAPSSGFNAYLFTHGGHGAIWRDGLCMPFVPTAAFSATSRRTTFSRSGWIIDGRYLGTSHRRPGMAGLCAVEAASGGGLSAPLDHPCLSSTGRLR